MTAHTFGFHLVAALIVATACGAPADRVIAAKAGAKTGTNRSPVAFLTDVAGEHGPTAPASSFGDAEILGVLDTANGGEVEQGKIAEAKGQSPAVKRFGKMMVTDHSAAREKGQALAKRLGLNPSPSNLASNLKNRSDQLVTQFHRVSAAAFDGVYIGAQITLHQDVLDLIDKQLAPQAHSADVQMFLGDIRAHVTHHLKAAEKTMKDLAPKSS
jgi:putative membrane protein